MRMQRGGDSARPGRRPLPGVLHSRALPAPGVRRGDAQNRGDALGMPCELWQVVLTASRSSGCDPVPGLPGRGRNRHVISTSSAKKVRAEGTLACGRRHLSHFAQGGHMVDLGEGHGDAEGGHVGSPATGPDSEDATAAPAQFPVDLPNRAGDGVAGGFRQRPEAFDVDGEYPVETRHPAVADDGAAARDQRLFERRLDCGQRRGVHPLDLERATLQEVDRCSSRREVPANSCRRGGVRLLQGAMIARLDERRFGRSVEVRTRCPALTRRRVAEVKGRAARRPRRRADPRSRRTPVRRRPGRWCRRAAGNGCRSRRSRIPVVGAGR